VDITEAQAKLPRYALQQPLRSGAQGDVFRGLDRDGTEVVVKIISGGWVNRGEREIEALRRISHPAVVRLVGDGTVSDGSTQLPYVVTEFVPGDDLRHQLDVASLDVTFVPLIVKTAVEGLEALWAERIVHRDIKPSNLMVRPDGRAVLLDLGVARCLDMTTLTVGVGWLGTPGYMSPEQALGKHDLTIKSDIYALGITAFEAIVGSHPFGGNQNLMVTSTHAPAVPNGAPCSAVVAALVSTMLHPSPLMRPLPTEILSALAGEVT
jgi:serine/threonine protein kinase